MINVGFWDYTCPRHGSLERYTRSDWDLLLDDMSAGGFNSLVLGIKWLTTGYHSRLPWLDQDPACSAINSNNDLLHYALSGARQRNISVWLLIVATIFPNGPFNLPGGISYWTGEYTVYDLDEAGLAERIDLLFGEVVEFFGSETDGLVVELEFCDGEAEHMQQTRNVGLETYYLTRGVMTFNIPPDLPTTTLEEQWRLSLEDAFAYHPDVLWFMGSDCCLDGLVCSNLRLPQWGFLDGRLARQRINQMAQEMAGGKP